MKKVQYGKRSQMFAEKWEELSPKQLIYCLNVLESNSFYLAQAKIMYYLSNVWFKIILVKLNRLSKTDVFYTYQLNALRKSFDFLIDRPSFKEWKYTKIKIKGITWYGPEDLFENLTIGEFARAEDYYKLLQKDYNNTEYLDKFLACIYRPKKYWWFGKRAPFTDDIIAKNYQAFRHLHLGTKKAILLNFSAVRDNLFSRFKDAFTKSDEKTDLTKYGWTGTISLFCTKNNIVPAEFRQRKLIDVLITLDTLAIEAKERKKNER